MVKLQLLIIGSIFLTACNSENSSSPDTRSQSKELDMKLAEMVESYSLMGDPFKGRTVPDINSDIAQLGKHLFFSKSLSGDRDVACVSCHHPMLGGGDNLSLSVGVEAQNPDLLGPGRLHRLNAINYDGGPTVPRNAPTTFNVGGWDHVLFADGRIESIGKTAKTNGDDGLGIRTPESAMLISDPTSGRSLTHAQARFPITSNEEMKGFNHFEKDNYNIRYYLSGRLGGYGEASNELDETNFWLDKFRVAFSQATATAEQLITEQNVSFAIAQYELSQVFTETPWKKYINGEKGSISESAKRGALLFYQTKENGGANCAACHSGDFFTDERFHNIAAPQIGRGKGDGAMANEDFGRYRETKDESDKYTFRTPSLLNVAETGPWMHSGSYTTLTAAVIHSLNPKLGIEYFDASEVSQPGVQNLSEVFSLGQKALSQANFESEEVDFNDNQIEDLVAFLESLTDPCITSRECMAPWLINDNESQDPNGDQLNAVDQNGNYL